MKSKTSLEAFTSFAEAYSPFPWECNETSHQDDIRGKHGVLISLVRYWQVVGCLESIAANTPLSSVMDIGSYPGSFIKIIRKFLGNDVEYAGIGLGFSDEYKSEMHKLGGKLFETELDPDFIQAKLVRDWPFSGIDCCMFLDVIEHLVNPVDCLDRINKALRMGGKLIITTDNITALGCIVPMLRRGESPNIHPLRSQLFYRGDWRPHFKEFSRAELIFFLEYCGFRLIEHRYFEREQGDYYFDGKGRVRRRSRYRGLKGLIRKMLFRYIPHLRDHQILIAEKIFEFSDQALIRPTPTSDLNEWSRLRESFGL
ncbi:MAG: methyltransferase domain-containing protein [Betaproteobacteria bacterium]